MLHLRQSTRKQAKIKLALQGCAGSGKTYSALLLAYGMTADWSKIAVIDSENGSADLYAHLGTYNVVSLGGDYSPENYIEAITLCENAGMDVIIVDSISQCWDYLLDFHASLQGNSFANWAISYTPSKCLCAENPPICGAYHLHHAYQAGLCAQ